MTHIFADFLMSIMTDNDIHRIEKSAEYTGDEILDKKKMLRLNLKDKLLMMLKNERASSNEK
jgi:uncharacterized protein YdcH (DUF465 family)